MEDKEHWENESRRKKEFVYDQLRKRLCYHVVNGDISNSYCPPLETLTTEQVRTVFNIGYKLALFQTINSLKKITESESSELKQKEKIIKEIEDRLTTSDCLVMFEGSNDPQMLEQAIKRAKDFQFEVTRDDITALFDERM